MLAERGAVDGVGRVGRSPVIGVPDEVFEKPVKAFVVPRASDCNGLCERVAIFCKGGMPQHPVPKEIIMLASP